MGFSVHNKAIRSVIEFTSTLGRISTIKLKASPIDILIFNIHASTETSEATEKDDRQCKEKTQKG